MLEKVEKKFHGISGGREGIDTFRLNTIEIFGNCSTFEEISWILDSLNLKKKNYNWYN